ncbi:hypothetical protein T492DRAFT_890035 [Pavlovales sp. CCMP2436]|nr:hypothetical protein T492DRAFT_890035 [Pavlovales sp. CCMP2436]
MESDSECVRLAEQAQAEATRRAASETRRLHEADDAAEKLGALGAALDAERSALAAARGAAAREAAAAEAAAAESSRSAAESAVEAARAALAPRVRELEDACASLDSAHAAAAADARAARDELARAVGREAARVRGEELAPARAEAAALQRELAKATATRRSLERELARARADAAQGDALKFEYLESKLARAAAQLQRGALLAAVRAAEPPARPAHRGVGGGGRRGGWSQAEEDDDASSAEELASSSRLHAAVHAPPSPARSSLAASPRAYTARERNGSAAVRGLPGLAPTSRSPSPPADVDAAARRRGAARGGQPPLCELAEQLSAAGSRKGGAAAARLPFASHNASESEYGGTSATVPADELRAALAYLDTLALR